MNGQFQPMQPYQPYGQIQQPMMPVMPMQQQRPGMPGRSVGSVDEITPSEVPMDGSMALFPLNDGSSIFAKAWNRDGTITTVRYAPVSTENAEDDSSGLTLADVMQQLDDIKGALKDLNKPAVKKAAPKKKGSEDDD